MPNPLSHQRLDRGSIFPCQPACEFPEDDSVQFPVHNRGIVSKLIKVRPSRQFAIQAFDKINLVRAIIAGQFFNQLVGEASELVFGYCCYRTHRTSGSSFANDAVPQENKPVIDVRNMGFLQIKRQLQGVFQKQATFVSDGLSLRLTAFDDYHEVSQSREPPPQLLSEPSVNLSAHWAPIIQPSA